MTNNSFTSDCSMVTAVIAIFCPFVFGHSSLPSADTHGVWKISTTVSFCKPLISWSLPKEQ